VAEEVDSASDEGHESIIVRCDAPSVSCERASDAVQTTRRDIIQIQ